MLRVPLGGDRVVNRRYTIRSFDPAQRAVTIDVSLHGAGPGTDWISAARAGDRIDAIGPRGKITVRPEADWHLFVADETGLPGVLAMIEALAPGSTRDRRARGRHGGRRAGVRGSARAVAQRALAAPRRTVGAGRSRSPAGGRRGRGAPRRRRARLRCRRGRRRAFRHPGPDRTGPAARIRSPARPTGGGGSPTPSTGSRRKRAEAPVLSAWLSRPPRPSAPRPDRLRGDRRESVAHCARRPRTCRPPDVARPARRRPGALGGRP